MNRMQGLAVISALTISALSSCGIQNATAARREDVDLPLTYGGFLKDGPQTERIDGTCRPDNSRTILSCDLYNGLPGWTLTEVTLRLTRSPYKDEDVRDYKAAVVIKPFTAENVTIRLGLQLPADDHFRKYIFSHWGWLLVGAKGYPTRQQ